MNQTLSVYKTYENRKIVSFSKQLSFRKRLCSIWGEGIRGVNNKTDDNQVQCEKINKYVKKKMFENNLYVFTNNES